jgi:hypothetical protein
MLNEYLKVDVGQRRLLDMSNNNLDAAQIRWPRGDTLCLCLEFVRRIADAVGAYAVPSSSTLLIGIKDPGNLDASTYLASADASAWNVAGDWTEAGAGSAKQSVRLALDASSLTALLPDGTREKLLTLEISETDDEGLVSTLVQADITIFADAIRGNEGVPAPTEPTYLTAAQTAAAIASAMAEFLVTAPNGDTWAVRNGEPVANLTGTGGWQ